MNVFNEYIKLGLAGISINLLINLTIYWAKGVSFSEYFPSYLIWLVLVGIGISQAISGKDYIDTKEIN